MRKYARKDSNHKEIIQVFRDLGATVFDTASQGSGFPDCVIGFRNVNVLVEIKDGSLPPSKRKLTPDELKFHETWRGKVVVINNVEEAIELIKNM
jgi:Holliday junction resolvase